MSAKTLRLGWEARRFRLIVAVARLQLRQNPGGIRFEANETRFHRSERGLTRLEEILVLFLRDVVSGHPA